MICPFCQYEHDNKGDLYGCPNCEGKPMTAPQYSKHLGAPSLSHVSRVSGVALQTLYDWHKTKPDLFRCVVLGVLSESNKHPHSAHVTKSM